MSLRTHTRRGMSLLETTIALMVLSVGILTMVSQIAVLHSLRRQTKDTRTVEAVLSTIVERIQGARWKNCLDTTVAPWSLARIEPGTGVTSPANQPLMDDSAMPYGDRALRGLSTLGLTQQETGVPNLRIYVEYYRAVTYVDPATSLRDTAKPGIMHGEDVTYTGVEDFQNRFRFDIRAEQVTDMTTVKANRARYRLADTSSATSQVGPDEPVLIRVFATWGSVGQMAIITSRKL